MTRDKAIAFAEENGLPIDVDQEVAVLDRPEPLGPRGRDRLPRGHLERARSRTSTTTPRTRPSPRERRRGRHHLRRGRPGRDRRQAGHHAAGHRAAQRARRRAGRRPARHGRGPAGRHQEPRGLRGARRDRADHRAPGAGERHRRARPGPVQARPSSSAGASWSTTACGSRRSSARSTRFIDEAQQHVTGEIRMTLHGGRAVVTGRRSDAVAVRLRPGHLRHRRHLRPVAGQGLRRAVGPAVARSPRPATRRRSAA